MDFITNETIQINEETEKTKAEDTEKRKDPAHDVRILLNNLTKICESENIPFFVAFYTEKNGYEYRGLFPEEIDERNMESQWGRFPKFLETVIGFNKEDYKPVITKNK